MTDPTEAELFEAKRRGDLLMAGPRAETAYYDAERNRIVVLLTTSVEIAFAPQDAQGLQNASVEDLKAVEVDTLGLAIRFPTIDADYYVPGLLAGRLGSARWMEQLSQRKAEARQLNPA